MDRARQKRRLVLSPVLVIAFGLLGFAAAPDVLYWMLCLVAALLLSPGTAWLIDASERNPVSGWTGACCVIAGFVVLRALVADQSAQFYIFILAVTIVAICAGLGVSSVRRLRAS